MKVAGTIPAGVDTREFYSLCPAPLSPPVVKVLALHNSLAGRNLRREEPALHHIPRFTAEMVKERSRNRTISREKAQLGLLAFTTWQPFAVKRFRFLSESLQNQRDRQNS